jgi:hypothetical protein
MIKKLLLITGLMLSANLWADMDIYCEVDWNELFEHVTKIRENCERNNILFMRYIPEENISRVIAEYCRHDRQINVSNYGAVKELVCVLYDSEARISLR